MPLPNLSLVIINCCSITNKKLELETLLSLYNIDILIGTESHLDNSIFNSEIFPSGYSIFRKDRDRHGGGVFILIKNTIPSSQIQYDSQIELVWSHIHTSSNKDIIIGSFYCPPHSHIGVLDDLHASVSHIKSTYSNAQPFIGGDFNCPGINWSDGGLTNSHIPGPFRERLIEIADDYYLDQLVRDPTRGLNILDLCFTTHPDKVNHCQVIPGISDHHAVLISFSHQIQFSKQKKNLLI